MLNKKAKLAFALMLLLICCRCNSSNEGLPTPTSSDPAVATAQLTPTVIVRPTLTATAQYIPLASLWPAYIQWQEMAFTRASVDDLLSTLGEPNHIQSFQEDTVYQYWPSPKQDIFVNVTLIEDTVQLVTIVAWPGTSLGRLKDVMIGRKAKAVALYKDYRGQEDVVYAFPTEGFATEAQDEALTVVQFFAPISQEVYMSQWGSKHPRQVFFPSRLDLYLAQLKENDVVIGQTRMDLESVLGRGTSATRSPVSSCQWRRYQIRSDDRHWNFRIDVLYSDQIAAIINTHVDDASMTFADIVREFGIPDLVLGNPNDPRSQEHTLALVYLSAGMQFNVGGIGYYTGEEFGGEGITWNVWLFNYDSAEEYLQDPCAASLRTYTGSQEVLLSWETVNPFKQ